MKRVLAIIILSGIFFSNLGTFCYAKERVIMNYGLNLQSKDIVSVHFSIRTGQGTPKIVNEKYLRGNYSYSTDNDKYISYIVHYLNAINFIDDGKTVGSADGVYISIDLRNADDSVTRLFFADGQRFTYANKQYSVDKNGYNRFIDLIYAFKTGKIVLNDEVNFKPSDWAKISVEKAIDQGLVSKWNQIDYVNNINRLEVCQLLDNMLTKYEIELPKSADNMFEDTYDIAVKNLSSLNIINGKSETEFAPYDYITREEFAKILSRTYSYLNNDSIESRDFNYIDRDRISEYAVDDVKKVTQLGLMHGNENGEFEPQNNITKEEVIVTLLRLSEIASVDGIIAQ